MGLPVSGSWYTRYANEQAYVGAQRWGTGNNPIHEVYGEGPPLRSTGRYPGPDDPTPELSDVPETIETAFEYGYTMDDIDPLTPVGMPPGWGTETDEWRNTAGEYPAWNENGEAFRDSNHDDPRLWSGIMLDSFPTESVTEGWRNKETGAVADARTSDPSQYEMQTSMQQVNPAPGRNNDAAVTRQTDDPRFNIMTRLTGQKQKPWSQGQRNADMFPYQQDLIIRPFWYRIGATADPNNLIPNEMYVVDPIQRDVPPDPDFGPEETNVYTLEEGNGGYTAEDLSYA
jgi:hypothetical protein